MKQKFVFSFVVLLTIIFLTSQFSVGQELTALKDINNVKLSNEINLFDGPNYALEENTIISLKSSDEEPTFYLDINGITIKCINCVAGDTGRVNGVVYKAVDRSSLNQMIKEGADLSAVCTSLIKNMNGLFYGQNNFNQDISSWDVSNVTHMGGMFAYAYSFNQDIGSWDVSNVIRMDSMLWLAYIFNQNIGDWNVSNVTNMNWMFDEANAFNQNINSWNVSKVTDMSYMFRYAISFNQSLDSWNVSNVTDMSSMFADAQSFNQDIGNWDVSNVTEMNGMFEGATSFNQNIGNWNVGHVTRMEDMFHNAGSFNQNISLWNVSNVKPSSSFRTGMKRIFAGSNLSTGNYSKILNGWSKLDLQHGVTLDAGEIQYDSTAIMARQSILSEYGWTIKDGGLAANTTSISEKVKKNTLKIYPVPANDMLFLETNSSGRVQIFDIQGKLVMNQQIENIINEINVSDLSIGTYLLKFESANELKTVHFLKN